MSDSVKKKRRGLAARARRGLRRLGAVAVVTALAVGLGWHDDAQPAQAATVYEILGDWVTGTAGSVAGGAHLRSEWKFNINDDRPAPSNDPVHNVVVTFTVENAYFSNRPDVCLVEAQDPAVPLTPVSSISADGKTLVCNIGTRDQGTAELALSGLIANGPNDSYVSITGKIGNVQATPRTIRIRGSFAMDMKFSEGQPTVARDADWQFVQFPWSLRHEPGGEAGPNKVEYTLTFETANGELLEAVPGSGCDVQGSATQPGHPRSGGGPAERRAPYPGCTLTPVSGRANTFILALDNIDYSKTILPRKDSMGNDLDTEWDVVAAGELNLRFKWAGATTVSFSSDRISYRSVANRTSYDDRANNSNSRAMTRGIWTHGWNFGVVGLPGTQWTDTSRAVAGATILSNVGAAFHDTNPRPVVLCNILDAKYVKFESATLMPAGMNAVPGVRFLYYVGNGQGGNMAVDQSTYEPNTFSCSGAPLQENGTPSDSNWVTEANIGNRTVKAVYSYIPNTPQTQRLASEYAESGVFTMRVRQQIRPEVREGQDIWTWGSYSRNNSWQSPGRDTNGTTAMPGSGTATPRTRYPFAAGGRDIMRTVRAIPKIEKHADQGLVLPGAIVTYTLKFRADASLVKVNIPEMEIRDLMPGLTTYVEGSASIPPSRRVGQYLYWDLTDITSDTEYTITYQLQVYENGVPGQSFTNRARAGINGAYASTDETIRITDAGFVTLKKTVDRDVAPYNGGSTQNTWTVKAKSFDSRSTGYVDVIDILPYNGDGRGTSFSGSYTIGRPVNVGGTSPRIYYTTHDPAQLSEDPTDRMHGLGLGNPAGSRVGWTTAYRANATAIRVIWTTMYSLNTRQIDIPVSYEGVSPGDTFVNKATAKTARHELIMRTSAKHTVGEAKSVKIKKWVRDQPREKWHDAQTSDDYPEYRPGDTVLYDLQVTNTSTETMRDVEITDDRVDLKSLNPLPNGLVLKNGKAVIPELLPGKMVRIGYEVPLSAAQQPGELVNTACALSPETDPRTPDACDPAGIVIKGVNSLTWEKMAAGTEELLRGSEWELTSVDLDDQPTGASIAVTDCIAASASQCNGRDIAPEAGKFTVKPLEAGRYRLVETRAPAGYQLDPTPYYIDVEGDTEFDQAILNYQQEGLNIPLTGGLGTTSFLIGAGLLGAILTAALLLQERRRRLAIARS